MTSTRTLDAAALLAGARRARSEADAAEVRVFQHALAWAEAHVVSDELDAATWGNTPMALAGEGAPMVGEFCVAEFAAALGMSTDSGRALLAHALEISYRLPRLWDRVVAGELPVWRARRIAEHTLTLSLDAAAHVDVQVTPFAHKLGPAATERVVEEAIARYMPGLADERAQAAAKNRFVNFDHTGTGYSGTSSLFAFLDTADALDLEHVVRDGAETLKVAGSEESLDVRRAAALGALARGELMLGFETGFETLAGARSSTSGGTSTLVEERGTSVSKPPRTRDLVLYVHLHGDTASLENTGGQLLSAEQVRTWCGNPNTRVIIKPVIDLVSTSSTNGMLAVSAYAIPDRIREVVITRDGTCIFPFCTRPSRRCDLDHITPYDPDGPPDQTSTENLAPLCRRHHRLKTHGGWTYEAVLEPDGQRAYRWRSPHGYEYLRTRTGTETLTPRPVTPPGD